MKLYSNWKQILKKAYSIRFIILAGILSGLEFVLPYFSDAIPQKLFLALSFTCTVLAFIARLTVQKGLPDDKQST